MRKRQVLVELPKPEFELLKNLAGQEEREVFQQASYLLRQALRQLQRSELPREEAPDAA